MAARSIIIILMQREIFTMTDPHNANHLICHEASTEATSIMIAVIGDKYTGKNRLLETWIQIKKNDDASSYVRYMQILQDTSSIRVCIDKFSSKRQFRKNQRSYDIIFYVYNANLDKRQTFSSSYFNILEWIHIAKSHTRTGCYQMVIGLQSVKGFFEVRQRYSAPTINGIDHVVLDDNYDRDLRQIFQNHIFRVYDSRRFLNPEFPKLENTRLDFAENECCCQ